MSATPVGLRIDVDTLRGTRDGVPALVELLARYNINASFFMSVGPDNMGRNLWRLLKPKFLWKMLRSDALNLYGYDILLRGTAWPGPSIAARCAGMIRLPKDAGHEVGLHAWDHFSWQAHIDRFSAAKMQTHMQRGFDTLADLLGEAPRCSAAAGWRCNERALLMKEQFGFSYNSDCRGNSVFAPLVEGQTLTPQIPVTLPTYDEIIGANGVTDANFNRTILDLCKPEQLNVYAVHAEVEGIGYLRPFERMLQMAQDEGIAFVPLGAFLPQPAEILPRFAVECQSVAGRDGWLAIQANPCL